MLKSKKSLYFLFPLVIIIWGIIIWKVVGSFADHTPVSQSLPFLPKEPIPIKKKDTFSLIKLKKDPFLGTAYTKPIIIPEKIKTNPPEIQWPSINYLGLVSDTKIASKIHILKINNIQYLLEQGEEVDGLKLIRAKQDKVTMVFKGKQKEFVKSFEN